MTAFNVVQSAGKTHIELLAWHSWVPGLGQSSADSKIFGGLHGFSVDSDMSYGPAWDSGSIVASRGKVHLPLFGRLSRKCFAPSRLLVKEATGSFKNVGNLYTRCNPGDVPEIWCCSAKCVSRILEIRETCAPHFFQRP